MGESIKLKTLDSTTPNKKGLSPGLRKKLVNIKDRISMINKTLKLK